MGDGLIFRKYRDPARRTSDPAVIHPETRPTPLESHFSPLLTRALQTPPVLPAVDVDESRPGSPPEGSPNLPMEDRHVYKLAGRRGQEEAQPALAGRVARPQSARPSGVRSTSGRPSSARPGAGHARTGSDGAGRGTHFATRPRTPQWQACVTNTNRPKSSLHNSARGDIPHVASPVPRRMEDRESSNDAPIGMKKWDDSAARILGGDSRDVDRRVPTTEDEVRRRWANAASGRVIRKPQQGLHLPRATNAPDSERSDRPGTAQGRRTGEARATQASGGSRTPRQIVRKRPDRKSVV